MKDESLNLNLVQVELSSLALRTFSTRDWVGGALGHCVSKAECAARLTSDARAVWRVQLLAEQQEQDVRAGALGGLPARAQAAGGRRGAVLPLRAGPPGERVNGDGGRGRRARGDYALRREKAIRRVRLTNTSTPHL